MSLDPVAYRPVCDICGVAGTDILIEDYYAALMEAFAAGFLERRDCGDFVCHDCRGMPSRDVVQSRRETVVLNQKLRSEKSDSWAEGPKKAMLLKAWEDYERGMLEFEKNWGHLPGYRK